MFLFVAHKDKVERAYKGDIYFVSPEDFEISLDLDKEELIEKWSDLLYRELIADPEDAGYTLWIFNFGKLVYTTSEYSVHEPDYIWDIVNFVDGIAISRYRETHRIEENEKIRNYAEQDAKYKEFRKAQFEQLKKEFA